MAVVNHVPRKTLTVDSLCLFPHVDGSFNYVCRVYLPEINVDEAETETTEPPASPVLAMLQPQLAADSS